MYCLFDSLVVFMVILTFWFWTLLSCSRRQIFSLRSWYCVSSDYLAYDPCLFIDFNFHITYIFVTLCIWVPHSLSLPITEYNQVGETITFSCCFIIFVLLCLFPYFQSVISMNRNSLNLIFNGQKSFELNSHIKWVLECRELVTWEATKFFNHL